MKLKRIARASTIVCEQRTLVFDSHSAKWRLEKIAGFYLWIVTLRDKKELPTSSKELPTRVVRWTRNSERNETPSVDSSSSSWNRDCHARGVHLTKGLHRAQGIRFRFGLEIDSSNWCDEWSRYLEVCRTKLMLQYGKLHIWSKALRRNAATPEHAMPDLTTETWRRLDQLSNKHAESDRGQQRRWRHDQARVNQQIQPIMQTHMLVLRKLVQVY